MAMRVTRRGCCGRPSAEPWNVADMWFGHLARPLVRGVPRPDPGRSMTLSTSGSADRSAESWRRVDRRALLGCAPCGGRIPQGRTARAAPSSSLFVSTWLDLYFRELLLLTALGLVGSGPVAVLARSVSPMSRIALAPGVGLAVA